MKRFSQLCFFLLIATAMAGCDAGNTTSTQTASSSGKASSSTSSSTPAASAARPQAAKVDTTCGIRNFRQGLLDKINQTRASARMCGETHYEATGPLRWNDKLAAAGLAHAADLANKNYFSHTSQDGRTFSERITAAGYKWQEAGENIAAGQTTLDQVMSDWLKSPGHCANLMNPVYTEVGVSCIHNSKAVYKHYWGMEFALPK